MNAENRECGPVRRKRHNTALKSKSVGANMVRPAIPFSIPVNVILGQHFPRTRSAESTRYLSRCPPWAYQTRAFVCTHYFTLYMYCIIDDIPRHLFWGGFCLDATFAALFSLLSLQGCSWPGEIMSLFLQKEKQKDLTSALFGTAVLCHDWQCVTLHQACGQVQPVSTAPPWGVYFSSFST